jgi:dihydrolipoamide dehydrogenase
MNPTQITDKFDVIVIGGGPGGYVCAIRAAQLGFKTACVEMQKTLGGTCLNIGCIPSKALLESSHHFEQAHKEFADHGIELDQIKLNLTKMLARKDSVVKGITGGVEFLFKKNKITWLKGFGSVESANTIAVSDASKSKKEYFEAKHIVLASGSVPIELPFAPFDHKFIVDSTDALNFEKVPEHLIVVGGGVIGLELGSVWRRLGAKVTVIEALDKILGNTDAEVSTTMLKIMNKQGIEFHLKTFLKKAEVKGNKVIVRCSKNEGEELSFEGDKVLIAVGRKPFNKDMGLDKLGIQMQKNGTVVVDKHFCTNVPSIYAIGDLITGPMLAHKAEEEGMALAEMLAHKAGHVNYDAIPGVVYTWPEIATVGLSEEMCKEQNIPYRKGSFNFKANGRAKAMGHTEGFVKILAHAQTDKLLGAHIIGPMASEIIAEIVIAIEYGASAEDIARSVHAHPTLCEVIKEAALDVDKRAIHA